jgi:uridine kinase
VRIHITGASGSGTTTLGGALAQALGCAHLDTDDYYWLPTKPPFQHKREVAERVALLTRDLQPRDVVLSGSIGSWGAEVEDAFDLIVFLYLPVEIRLARLRQRELERYGAADPAFLEWASLYDTGPPEGRSLAKHDAWLAARKCPVLRLEGDLSVAQRVARVLVAIEVRCRS